MRVSWHWIFFWNIAEIKKKEGIYLVALQIDKCQ